MELLTNPLVLALLGSLFAIFISYLYFRKQQKDDEELRIDNFVYFRIGGLTFLVILMTTGYMSYTHSITEEASLATEFFQTGQPQF